LFFCTGTSLAFLFLNVRQSALGFYPDRYLPARKEMDLMLVQKPRLLPENLNMPCYCCEKEPATHLCRYKIGELTVQVCLCPECMKIDTGCLLKNTVGIQETTERPGSNYLIFDELKYSVRSGITSDA
jgi:hypothetical protein